jgi:hypothetical protein
LEGKARKEATMSDEEWDILDRKTLGTIRLCLGPSMAFNITEAKTTKALIIAMAKLYENPHPQIRYF